MGRHRSRDRPLVGQAGSGGGGRPDDHQTTQDGQESAYGRSGFRDRPALREWRKAQIEERLRAGEAWEAGEWVASDQLGRPINPEYLTRRFQEIAGGVGLPSITVKQLRHSHATALLAAGEAPKVVQERLGHSSISVTMDIYASVLPGMQRQAIDRLAAMMSER